MPATDADIAAMSFEAALKELEQIVDKLEKGTVELEESIAIYARGEALKRHCNDLLKVAEERICKDYIGRRWPPGWNRTARRGINPGVFLAEPSFSARRLLAAVALCQSRKQNPTEVRYHG